MVEVIAKVVACGDAGVGKTSIFRRALKDEFSSKTQSTLGVEFACKTYGDIKLQLWDTAGQERYQSITRAYFRGSVAILFVFDLTKEESLNHVEDVWLPEAKKEGLPNALYYLIGNKSDHTERIVTEEQAIAVAQTHNMRYMQTSAKLGTGVEPVFESVALEMRKRIKSIEDTKTDAGGDTIRLEVITEEGGGGEEEKKREKKVTGCSC